MPELPDIEVFSSNLKSMLAGKKLKKIKVVNGKKLKDTSADLKILEGKNRWNTSRKCANMRMGE